MASCVHTDEGFFPPRVFKSEETFKTTSPCRDGEMEAQRRRRTEKSQLVVTELRPPDTQSPAFSSQSPGSHGLCLSPLQPTPLWWVQGTDIKACLQYPTPPHPIPTWRGARHPEPAHPQCREHRSAVATPAHRQARRLEAAAVLLRRTGVSGQR